MNNFKVVRQTYDCTSVDLAQVLDIKSSSSITTIENGKSYPSYELLNRYADFFGVSIDWLMGRTDIPYTEASVSCAERSAQRILSSYDITQEFMSNLPKTYLDESQRAKLYSLEVRANLAYILSSTYDRNLDYLNFCKSRKNDEDCSILELTFNYIIDRRYLKYVESPLKKKDEKFIRDFWMLVRRNFNKPVFCIEDFLAKQKEAETSNPKDKK